MRPELHHTPKTRFLLYRIVSAFGFLCVFNVASGQDAPLLKPTHNQSTKPLIDSSIKIISTLSDAPTLSNHYILTGFKAFTCKGIMFYFRDTTRSQIEIVPVFIRSTPKQDTVVLVAKKPYLTVHGNILYSLNYRSYIDTPFAMSDVYQHSIQSYLDITVKDRYPVRLYINTSFSNTPLFKDYVGLNFQFNTNTFSNLVKEKLTAWGKEQIIKLDTLNQLKNRLNSKYAQLLALREWMSDPGMIQRMIEAKEREYVQSIMPQPAALNPPQGVATKDIPELNTGQFSERGFSNWVIPAVKNYGTPKTKTTADSSKTSQSLQAEYDQKNKQADSLSQEILRYQAEYETKKQGLVNKSDSILNVINGVKDLSTLKEKLKTSGIPDSVLPPGYRKLLAVRSFGIGTIPVNYSELTIKNISITGIQAEYNPSYYVAIATGFISYRFRDYILNQSKQPKQYVTALRFGLGKPESNSLIVTYYTGRKYLYNYSTSIDSQVTEPKYNIMGVSILGRYQFDKNNFVTGEMAKSSLPYYSSNPDKENLLGSTFKLKDHTNQAWSVSASSVIPSTQTKVSANYRQTGNNFQSYSLFTTSSSQSAWYVKADQQLFKRKLSINASLRKNDFNNPYISQAYSSTTVFKSIQATLRIKKLPVLSIGYYPSSQITKINEEQFSESLFYTFVASAAHFYKSHQTLMNTSATFTRFYNKSADTNFVYFNTKNISLVQGIIFKTFSLQSSFSYASNTSYSLYTAGQSLMVKISNALRLGGGMKYNHQTILANDLLGWSMNMQLKIKKLGNIDLYYDKGFIPGINKTLVANETGRVTYSRIF